jgi:hypothetical protein
MSKAFFVERSLVSVPLLQQGKLLSTSSLTPNMHRDMMRVHASLKFLVDQAFSIWYHHSIQDTGYYLWRMLPRAESIGKEV